MLRIAKEFRRFKSAAENAIKHANRWFSTEEILTKIKANPERSKAYSACYLKKGLIQKFPVT